MKIPTNDQLAVLDLHKKNMVRMLENKLHAGMKDRILNEIKSIVKFQNEVKFYQSMGNYITPEPDVRIPTVGNYDPMLDRL